MPEQNTPKQTFSLIRDADIALGLRNEQTGRETVLIRREQLPKRERKEPDIVLSKRAQKVLKVLIALEPFETLTQAEISNELDGTIDVNALSRDVMPELEKNGLVAHGSRSGYCLSGNARKILQKPSIS